MQQKSSWSSLGPSQLDSSLLNNIQKLFSERIDLSGNVEPNKGSIVMAIIKIFLKVFKINIDCKGNMRFNLFSNLIYSGFLGMRSAQDVWKVWYSANSSGLLLPAAFLMEIHI